MARNDVRKPAKPRNAQDATRRNVQHANKALARFDDQLARVEVAMDAVADQYAKLEARLVQLEVRVDRKLGPEVAP